MGRIGMRLLLSLFVGEAREKPGALGGGLTGTARPRSSSRLAVPPASTHPFLPSRMNRRSLHEKLTKLTREEIHSFFPPKEMLV